MNVLQQNMQPYLKIILFSVSANVSVALMRHFCRRRLTTVLKPLSAGQPATSSVADLRKEYSKQGIVDDDNLLLNGPIPFFKAWFEEARQANILEPNAMCVSTCNDNIPTSRIVLMKEFNESGFVWFTNYNSRKGRDLEANPVAAATFWWGDLERSVRIEGAVSRVSEAESDAYFNSRPRGSQIGAWSSNQSSEISSREDLDAQERLVQERFSDVTKPVPRPPHWGGYRLEPSRIEFWKGRQSRMHDRIVFERVIGASGVDGDWKRVRLQP